MHIVDESAIPQALITGINVRTALATYNMFLYLHFWYPVYKILYLDADKMQHLGQAILIHCVAQAFFLVLSFYFIIKDRYAIQHQAN